MGRKKEDTSLSIEVWDFPTHLRNAGRIVNNESKDLWISILLQPDKINADIPYNKSQISLHMLLKDIFEDHSSQDLITAMWRMRGHKTAAEKYICNKLELPPEQVKSIDSKVIGSTDSIHSIHSSLWRSQL